MSSRFGWVDFVEKDRRRMLDFMKLFSQRDTRDELGIGTIRDAFANYLFPGTSTIQTRARYFFFVPWIYREVERIGIRKEWTSKQIEEEVKKKERELISALEKGGESTDVIGIEARDTLKRFPSSIYWSGLGALKIRHNDRSQAAFHRFLSDRLRKPERFAVTGMDRLSKESDQLETNQQQKAWHRGLPDAPDGFLSETSLALTIAEADFLKDQILRLWPDSLLAAFLKSDKKELDVSFPWQCFDEKELKGDLGKALKHARNFSELMHGAALLYNLMLAKANKSEELIEGYRLRMSEWDLKINARWSQFRQWHDSPTSFWRNPAFLNAKIDYKTEKFVTHWLSLVVDEDGPKSIQTNNRAQMAIRERELSLKTMKRARLANPEARANWKGASGTSQLNYRWPTARAILNDIRVALEVAGDSDA